jgi:hypothetical protein
MWYLIRRWQLLSLLCILPLLAACAQLIVPAGTATDSAMTIVSPKDGATVKGPTVPVEVAVTNWTLVPAGGPVTEGQGHLHFFIDVPASTVEVGKAIPATATNAAYVHLGKEPLTHHDLTLTPGKHTITVVMGNASHIALARPAPPQITITVE